MTTEILAVEVPRVLESPYTRQALACTSTYETEACFMLSITRSSSVSIHHLGRTSPLFHRVANTPNRKQ